MDDEDLNLLFDAARAEAPVPSADLLSRIMADADAMQPVPQAVPEPAPKTGWFTRLVDGVGGWPALAGLATATVAGVWLGYAAPGQIGTLTETVWSTQAAGTGSNGYDVVDMFPSFEGIFVEEGA